MFLGHLDEAIQMRKHQSAEYTPKTSDDKAYKEKFDSHQHSIGKLCEVRWWIHEGMHLHYDPGTMPENKRVERLTLWYDQLSTVSVESSDSDSA